MARVSIVVPIFNVAPYLRDCLESILAQTFPDWEALCVDDGSTDESGLILDEYAKRDNRFIAWHLSNAGVSAARNFALDHATGEWLLFVDADDILSIEALQTCLSQDDNKSGMITFDYVEFPNDGKPVFPSSLLHKKVLHPRPLDWSQYVSASGHKKGLCYSLFHLQPIKEYRFKVGYPMGEDLEYLSRVWGATNRFVVLDVPLYAYRQRSDSATHSNMTAEKLKSKIEMSLCFRSNLLQVNRRTTRKDEVFFAKYITEFVAWEYFELPTHERSIVKGSWQKAISFLRNDNHSPMWYRGTSMLACLLPHEFVYRTLFWLPMYLKRKGLHR